MSKDQNKERSAEGRVPPWCLERPHHELLRVARRQYPKIILCFDVKGQRFVFYMKGFKTGRMYAILTVPPNYTLYPHKVLELLCECDAHTQDSNDFMDEVERQEAAEKAEIERQADLQEEDEIDQESRYAEKYLASFTSDKQKTDRFFYSKDIGVG